MKSYRAYLLGGVCLGLLTLTSGAKDGPSAPSATGANAKTGVLIVAENEAPAADPAPPSTPPGVTEYYGDTTPKSPPAFAAEAAMNPDYAAAPAALAEAPAAETAAAEAVAVAEEAPPPMTPPGVTEYYGDTAAASTAPFSAEATMNADYAAAPAAADGGAPAEAPADEAAPAPAATAEEAPPPMTPPGVTEYYGDTAAASTAPFSAEATMNADYAAEPAAPAAAAVEETPPPMTPPGVTEYYGDTTPKSPPAWAAEATMTPATAPAATQQAVEACRDALNAEAQTGTILFATSSWDVLPESFRTLDKIAKIAKDCSAGFVIEVGGHTDNTGKATSNKTISELRAQSVVKYLARAGVDAGKLKAVGYGQDNPVGDNGTVAGRRQNRRIAFIVTAN